MFRKMRECAKTFIYLDLLLNIAWLLATGIFGSVSLIVLVIRGDYEQAPTILASVICAVATLGFATWVSRDARRVSRELRLERRRVKALRRAQIADAGDNG